MRGGLGRAGAPVQARVALAHVIDEVLSLGFVTRKVVEMLCGHIAFALGFKKAFLSLLQEAYRIGEAMPSRGWHPLCKVLGDELRMVRVALPWATTDLRAQVAPHAWASVGLCAAGVAPPLPQGVRAQGCFLSPFIPFIAIQ